MGPFARGRVDRSRCPVRPRELLGIEDLFGGVSGRAFVTTACVLGGAELLLAYLRSRGGRAASDDGRDGLLVGLPRERALRGAAEGGRRVGEREEREHRHEQRRGGLVRERAGLPRRPRGRLKPAAPAIRAKKRRAFLRHAGRAFYTTSARADALQQRPLRRVPPRRRSPSSGSSRAPAARARALPRPRELRLLLLRHLGRRHASERGPARPVGWSVLCLGVIFVGSTLDFSIGRALGADREPAAQRKALLLVSIVYYLGVLSVFKYFELRGRLVRVAPRARSASHVARHAPPARPAVRHLVLHVRDDELHDRRLPPRARARRPLPRLPPLRLLLPAPRRRPHRPPAPDAPAARGASPSPTPTCRRAASGSSPPGSRRRSSSATRWRSQPRRSRLRRSPSASRRSRCVVAVYAYAVQIYCDFSGYTDVAIGSASSSATSCPRTSTRRTSPRTSRTSGTAGTSRSARGSATTSTSPARRLAQGAHGRRTANLMITMLLGGLWHGASWNFVIWGGAPRRRRSP